MDRPDLRGNWRQSSTLLKGELRNVLKDDASQRADFLRQACGGDTALREEIESLLGDERNLGDFLEKPALEATALSMASGQERSPVGHALGPYDVQSMLGAGGMGEVYSARDTRLGQGSGAVDYIRLGKTTPADRDIQTGHIDQRQIPLQPRGRSHKKPNAWQASPPRTVCSVTLASLALPNPARNAQQFYHAAERGHSVPKGLSQSAMPLGRAGHILSQRKPPKTCRAFVALKSTTVSRRPPW